MVRAILSAVCQYDKRLAAAAAEGNIHEVRRLVAKGADVNVKDELGQTPLHGAARGGHQEVVDLLIRCGANVTEQDQVGRTPLYESAIRGHFPVSEILISNCL